MANIKPNMLEFQLERYDGSCHLCWTSGSRFELSHNERDICRACHFRHFTNCFISNSVLLVFFLSLRCIACFRSTVSQEEAAGILHIPALAGGDTNLLFLLSFFFVLSFYNNDNV